LLLAGVAAGAGAEAPGACEARYQEALAASRKTLASGDSLAALEHLLRADEILSECAADETKRQRPPAKAVIPALDESFEILLAAR
jgi:hypothetical protein